MTETIPRELSAAALLELHHRRLDDMLDEVELSADAESWSDAKRRFEVFRREMDEHIRLEEEVMFPALERAAPVLRGPTVVMRSEHLAIRALLAAVGAALAEERPISRTTAELEAQLGPHNFKEERVLYPELERVALGPVRTGLAASVQALLGGRG
ncbi:MAG TPA: hemerythrin domain-containing protein [Polyangia bacterium]|nr:hemerythrin domain-containing protein [Polyangia bacterium]